MAEFHAPGWTADWLNAWLAAIGVCVLLDDVTLRWTDDPRPHAIFSHPDIDDLAVAIDATLPTVDELNSFAISRSIEGFEPFPRTVTSAAFGARAPKARDEGDFSLGTTVTDLSETDGDGLAHSPFDPPVPKGRTIHDRVRDTTSALTAESTSRSMRGATIRVKNNGLGFDYSRILQPADPHGDKWIDPAIETLAFFGLMLMPVRGDGRRATARGWTASKSRRGALTWPAWKRALGTAAIDGLLDRFWGDTDTLADVECVFGVVPYQRLGTMDTTVGFGSERVQ